MIESSCQTWQVGAYNKWCYFKSIYLFLIHDSSIICNVVLKELTRKLETRSSYILLHHAKISCMGGGHSKSAIDMLLILLASRHSRTFPSFLITVAMRLILVLLALYHSISLHFWISQSTCCWYAKGICHLWRKYNVLSFTRNSCS